MLRFSSVSIWFGPWLILVCLMNMIYIFFVSDVKVESFGYEWTAWWSVGKDQADESYCKLDSGDIK